MIGVRESYVNLSSNTEDKLQIYRDNFEKAYIEATEAFYRWIFIIKKIKKCLWPGCRRRTS